MGWDRRAMIIIFGLEDYDGVGGVIDSLCTVVESCMADYLSRGVCAVRCLLFCGLPTSSSTSSVA